MSGIIFSLVLHFLGLTHPFHISVCEIQHSSDAKTLQVSHRIFVDDLETALNQTYSTQLDVYNPTDPEELTRLIGDYVLNHFKIIVNGKELNGVFLGNEVEEDGMWCYIEYKKVKKIKDIVVINDILFETFDDQSNLVHVKYQGETKSLKLEGDTYQGVISFD